MARWPRHVVGTIKRWNLERRSDRTAAMIAREIYPVLWDSVRTKVAGTNAEITKYAELRAAQLSQERIDILLLTDPSMSGIFGTQLVLKASKRAVQLVLEAAASARRSAA